jgi:Flp pilus assembly protein TadG
MNASTDDRGLVGGAEALIVVIPMMLVAVLLITELWGALDARAAVSEAAREGARAYVEATSARSARDEALAAATASLVQHGRQGTIDSLATTGFGRCQRVEISVHTQVPRVRLFGLNSGGSYTITAHHSELVDPYRSATGLEGAVSCAQ